MGINEVEQFYPSTTGQWRKWLKANHVKKEAVWLIQYKKQTGIPSISWSEAVDEALCFGWIDSIKRTLDNERSIQYFSKRKPKSTWSKINKVKVEALIRNKKMTAAGQVCIDIAKANGSWNILDEIEELTMPVDLEKALRKDKAAFNYFMQLSKSVRKAMLQWVVMAKREETRLKRISEIARLAVIKQKPRQF